MKYSKNKEVKELQKGLELDFKSIDNLWIREGQKFILKAQVFHYYLKNKRKILKMKNLNSGGTKSGKVKKCIWVKDFDCDLCICVKCHEVSTLKKCENVMRNAGDCISCGKTRYVPYNQLAGLICDGCHKTTK